jgi:hypothetical protein
MRDDETGWNCQKDEKIMYKKEEKNETKQLPLSLGETEEREIGKKRLRKKHDQVLEK